MPAYWIARVKIVNQEKFAEYAKRAAPAITKAGGRFLARGGEHVTLEGQDYPRQVVIEFASLAQARACYQSPEYQTARAFLKGGAVERELSLVEGI